MKLFTKSRRVGNRPATHGGRGAAPHEPDDRGRAPGGRDRRRCRSGGRGHGLPPGPAGVDVLLLEKSDFPREKICGDGLTPRAVKQLVNLGVDLDAPGWLRNKGLRIIGGGLRLELDWPELSSFPPYGLVRTRMDFDEMLARHAEKAGARLMERTAVTGPVVDERTGRVTGVSARPVDDRGRRTGDEVTYSAPVVIAATASPPASRSPSASSAARTGRWAWRCAPTTRRPATTTPTWSPGSSCGTARRGRATCCPATAGSSASATAPRTSASACSTPPRPSSTSTTGRAAPLAGQHARGVGLPRREHGRQDRLRRAADGLQPQAALHPRGAARRRLRRHGQPVQRRGHRLRDGVRRAGRARCVQALARPEGPQRERALEGYPRS